MTWFPSRHVPQLPPDVARGGPWNVRQIMHNGEVKPLGTLNDFGNAQRFAETIANSVANNDRGRAWAGKQTSGVQAITVAWDVYVIPRLVLNQPGVMPIPLTVPFSDIDDATYRLAMRYRDTLHYR